MATLFQRKMADTFNDNKLGIVVFTAAEKNDRK